MQKIKTSTAVTIIILIGMVALLNLFLQVTRSNNATAYNAIEASALRKDAPSHKVIPVSVTTPYTAIERTTSLSAELAHTYDRDYVMQKLSATEPETTTESEWVSLGEYRITYYCPESCCNGKWEGMTATGAKPTPERTVAVDFRVIPKWSEVKIIFDGEQSFEDSNTYIAEDTGGIVRRTKTIDILVTDHSTATKYGVQYAEVWVKK